MVGNGSEETSPPSRYYSLREDFEEQGLINYVVYIRIVPLEIFEEFIQKQINSAGR